MANELLNDIKNIDKPLIPPITWDIGIFAGVILITFFANIQIASYVFAIVCTLYQLLNEFFNLYTLKHNYLFENTHNDDNLHLYFYECEVAYLRVERGILNSLKPKFGHEPKDKEYHIRIPLYVYMSNNKRIHYSLYVLYYFGITKKTFIYNHSQFKNELSSYIKTGDPNRVF